MYHKPHLATNPTPAVFAADSAAAWFLPGHRWTINLQSPNEDTTRHNHPTAQPSLLPRLLGSFQLRLFGCHRLFNFVLGSLKDTEHHITPKNLDRNKWFQCEVDEVGYQRLAAKGNKHPKYLLRAAQNSQPHVCQPLQRSGGDFGTPNNAMRLKFGVSFSLRPRATLKKEKTHFRQLKKAAQRQHILTIP